MYFTAFFTVTCRRLKEKRPKRRKGLSFSLVIPVEQQESFLVLLSHSLDPKCKWSREIIVWEKTTRKDEEEQVKRNNISSNHWCLLTLPRRVKQSESTVSLAWVRLILTWKRSKTWLKSMHVKIVQTFFFLSECLSEYVSGFASDFLSVSLTARSQWEYYPLHYSSIDCASKCWSLMRETSSFLHTESSITD